MEDISNYDGALKSDVIRIIHSAMSYFRTSVSSEASNHIHTTRNNQVSP